MRSTSNEGAPLLWVLAIGAGLACGARHLPEDGTHSGTSTASTSAADTSADASMTSAAEGAATTSSEGEDTSIPPDVPPDVPESCFDSQLLCDGKCIDPLYNEEHCGECGHACEQLGALHPQAIGSCWNRECRPTYYGCISAADGFETCAEYCASIGRECPAPEQLNCSGDGVVMWGEGRLEACEAYDVDEGIGVANIFCPDVPIPFGEFEIPDGKGIATYARCCCTQD